MGSAITPLRKIQASRPLRMACLTCLGLLFIRPGIPVWAQLGNIEILSQLGGRLEGLDVESNYACLGHGSNLDVLDVSNPNNPQQVGSVFLRHMVSDVDMSGSLAYVTLRETGLAVVDISNPSQPRIAGQCTTAGNAWAVHVVGNVAYVADLEGGLQIIDVGNPAHPYVVANHPCSCSGGGSYGRYGTIFVSDGVAYVTFREAGGFMRPDRKILQMIDVSDPVHPATAGQVQVPLNTETVYVSGGLAYVAGGVDVGVQIIDVSNPSQPSTLGSCNTPGIPYEICVSGPLAYVADGDSGLQVLDVSDPVRPNILTSYTAAGSAYEISVASGLAYIREGTRAVHVVDVANPSSPTRRGSYVPPLVWPRRCHISGDRVYITGWYATLQIVDIGKPDQPIVVGQFQPGDSATGLYVSGDRAYVCEEKLFHILDISNPSSPTLLGSCATTKHGYNVDVSGGFAYVAWWEGLDVIDVSDPTSPTRVARISERAWDVAVAGNLAILLTDYKFTVLDVSDPSAPMVLRSGALSAYPWSVDISGDAAYMAVDHSGLVVADISNPSSPRVLWRYPVWGEMESITVVSDFVFLAGKAREGSVLVYDVRGISFPRLRGSVDTPGSANAVAVSGDLAYVADDDGGLRIIDVTDPSAPAERGFYDTPGRADGVFVAGSLVFVADRFHGLQILDVANPSSPSLRSTYDTPGTAKDVFVSAGLAYVADGDQGLQIVDVSDPGAPTLQGSYDTAGTANDIHVSAGLAYMADGDRGLLILDVATPSSPKYRGSYDTPGLAQGVLVSGDLAYVADAATLQIIDVSDPARPALRGTCDTPGRAEDVSVSGNLAYVADGQAGLSLVDVSDPTSPTMHPLFNTAGYAAGVHAVGDVVYIADGDAGLQIIDRAESPCPPVLFGSATFPSDSTTFMDIDVSGEIATVVNTDRGLWILKITLPQTVDLAPGGFGMTPLTVSPGEPIDFTGYIENLGTAATTQPIVVDFAAASSDSPGMIVDLCPPLVVPAGLDPGQKVSLAGLGRTLGAIPPGRYVVAVVADEPNDIAEQDESNNIQLAAGELVVRPPLNDLRPSLFSYAPDQVAAGRTIAISGTVDYTGSEPSPSGFWIEFRCSPNADFSPPYHHLCDSLWVAPGLQPGTSYQFAIQRSVHGSSEGLPAGLYVVGMVVDPIDELPERIETNNVLWLGEKRLRVDASEITAAQNWERYR